MIAQILDTSFLNTGVLIDETQYSSFIWTERYRDESEFELKSPNVTDLQSKLLPGTVFTLLEDTSWEVMIVDTVIVEYNEEEETEEITVTGRSFETFAENRVARPSTNRELKVSGTENSYDWELWPGTTNPAEDHARALWAFWLTSSFAGSLTVDNLSCTKLIRDVYINRQVVVQPGNVYERVIDILKMDDLGIRCTAGVGGVNVQIHDGFDKTDSVIFSVAAGHFKTAKYGWSWLDFRNAVWAFSNYRYTTVGSPTGIAARVGYLEALDIKTASPYTKDIAFLNNRGKGYLTQHRSRTIFEGEVSSVCPYRYKSDYSVGDLVQVTAGYNIKQVMRVTEYTRIHDDKGDRGHPTLEPLA